MYTGYFILLCSDVLACPRQNQFFANLISGAQTCFAIYAARVEYMAQCQQGRKGSTKEETGNN